MRTGLRLLLPLLLALGTACAEREEPPIAGPGSASVVPDVTADVSAPQDRIFSFAAQGSITGRWHGEVVYATTGDEGVLEVETTFAEVRGQTVHLVQTWRLFLPELGSDWAGGSWNEGDPVRLALAGLLDLTTGRLVLNGVVDDGQISQAHVRGEAVIGEGGALMVGGELMLNPQPEPPSR
jgi:hypothetical protein